MTWLLVGVAVAAMPTGVYYLRRQRTGIGAACLIAGVFLALVAMARS